jgi:hypothetical protein
LPVSAAFLAAIASSLVWFGERFLSNNLALVWFVGVLGMCSVLLALVWCYLFIKVVAVFGVRSVLLIAVWCYLALQRVLLYCWGLIGRVLPR